MEGRADSPAILVTGFEAFGESDLNPSAEVARILDGTSIAGHSVHGVQLPVTASESPEVLEGAIDRYDPRIVLSIGLANGRSMLTLERVAINVLDFPIPDNEGSQPVDEAVVESGPTAYFASLPIKAILAAWWEAGIPGYISNSAGTYVCNLTFYRSMHLSKEHGYRAGVIHVPYLPQQAASIENGAPSMSLDLMVRAAKMALKISVERSEDITLQAGAVS
jgi:pyroglutamyl-peptidase